MDAQQNCNAYVWCLNNLQTARKLVWHIYVLQVPLDVQDHQRIAWCTRLKWAYINIIHVPKLNSTGNHICFVFFLYMLVDHITHIYHQWEKGAPSHPPGFLLPISPPPPLGKLRVEVGGTGATGLTYPESPGQTYSKGGAAVVTVHRQFIPSMDISMCLKDGQPVHPHLIHTPFRHPRASFASASVFSWPRHTFV